MEEKQSKVQKAKQYISKNKILCPVIACLVVVVLAMSGTVSSAENQREMMLNQLQVQTEQYEKLQSNFDTLSVQYDDMNGAYAAVKAEIANYQDQQETIDTLNTQLTEAQENYDTLSTENEKLKEQIAELKTVLMAVEEPAAVHFLVLIYPVSQVGPWFGSLPVEKNTIAFRIVET